MTLTIKISPEVFTKLNPQLKIAFILVESMDNRRHLKDSQHLLAEVEKLVRLTFHPHTFKTHALISPWKSAQQEFGTEARHYHTSVEKLLKFVLGGNSVAAKDTLTNLLRYLSLKYVVPLGADDVDKLKGTVHFGISTGKEKVGWFTSLTKGVLFYADEDKSGKKRVLGTKLDYRKNRATELSPSSTSALVHIEALPPLDGKKLNLMVKELQELVHSFCGGKVKVAALSTQKKAVSF